MYILLMSRFFQVSLAGIIFFVGCGIIMALLMLFSKKREPEDDTEESSERIVHIDDYRPWSKQVK